MIIDSNFYLIDWSKIEEKLLYKNFEIYISQNNSGEYDFTQPKETEWIEYISPTKDSYNYLENWLTSFEVSDYFSLNKSKLPKHICNECTYIFELMFMLTNDNYLFPDYPKEYISFEKYRTIQKIQHKIISPVCVASVLSLWKTRNYLSILEQVYEHPYKEYISDYHGIYDFECFSNYIKDWINIFERAYAKPGWGILVYF